MRRTRVRPPASSPLLAALAVVAVGGACEKAGQPLRIQVASTYGADGTCSASARHVRDIGATSLRVSARLKDAAGKAFDFCDARLEVVGQPIWGFDEKVAKVDLYVEAYNDAGVRLGSGALLDIDPRLDPGLPLIVSESEKYGCTPDTRLGVPRAFHTATLLPDGSVVFVGGLTAGRDGADIAAPEAGGVSFFATNSIEYYDARKHTISRLESPVAVRAFHRASLLPPEGTTYRILLSGGITADTTATEVAKTSPDKKIPAAFRFALDPAAKAAPAEILSIDVGSSGAAPKVSTSMASADVQAVNGVLQGTASLPGGDVLLAGGMQLAAGVGTAQATLAKTGNGATATRGMLSSPRAGSALAAISDKTAVLVGGLAMGGDMVKPFERIDAAALTSTPVESTLATLPTLFLPTVTWMDPPGGRLLISGGLQVIGQGFATNPPVDPMDPAAFTMFQVDTSSDKLTVLPAALKDADFTGKLCSGDQRHYKFVAFDAASRLPAGDRMLVTGGTPRFDGKGGECLECEDGDTSLACAVGQSLAVSIPQSALEKPLISPLGRLSYPRFGHTQTVLHDGTVLVVGGLTRRGGMSFAVAQTEIFNPAHPSGAGKKTDNGNTADIDDPLLDVILAQPAGSTARDPGGLAYNPVGDKSSPTHLCRRPENPASP